MWLRSTEKDSCSPWRNCITRSCWIRLEVDLTVPHEQAGSDVRDDCSSDKALRRVKKEELESLSCWREEICCLVWKSRRALGWWNHPTKSSHTSLAVFPYRMLEARSIWIDRKIQLRNLSSQGRLRDISCDETQLVLSTKVHTHTMHPSTIVISSKRRRNKNNRVAVWVMYVKWVVFTVERHIVFLFVWSHKKL